MADSKYVVGVYRDTGRRSGPEGKYFQEIVAVVFDPAINHSDMDMLFLGIHSAGFCRVDSTSGKVSCFGRSESLNLESSPEIDQFFVSRTLRLPTDEKVAPVTTEEMVKALRDRRTQKFHKS